MVVEQDISVEHDGREVQVVGQLPEESLAVIVAPEDLGATIAAAGHMIDGVRKIDAWWTRHAVRIS